MKKRLVKKVEKRRFQLYLAVLIQTAVFNPSVIGVLEEDSMYFLLNLLEGRWSKVRECLPESFEDVGSIINDVLEETDYSIPYGKFVKRLQKRQLGKIKNSDLALWRDHYLGIRRFDIRDVKEWMEEWGSTIEFAQSTMDWVNSMDD